MLHKLHIILWFIFIFLYCNRNKGSETHRLKSCDFAGWDSEKQFSLVTVRGSAPQRQKQPLHVNSSGSGSTPASTEKQACDAKEVEKENGDVDKENIHIQERELDIPPGERLSVVVACQAK